MNANISFPDREKGRGCDILIKYKDPKDKDSYAMVEVKSCNLNIDDLNKAIEQFNATTRDYRINKESTKIILHERRGGKRHKGKGCSVHALFHESRKARNILLINLNNLRKTKSSGDGGKTDSSKYTLDDLIIKGYEKWRNNCKK